MNKHLYRIVFNQARGSMMAVAENVRSNGKGDATGGSSSAIEKTHENIRLCMKLLAFAAKLAVGVLTFAATAHAQIAADPSAPRNQQATILQTANGTPQVNIQTPSAAGVSRNTYSRFDVESQGAILNNSRTNVQTQTGGWIQGNPWLIGGPARVILNEVNSSNPSQLRGPLEVAGSRAEVIIANPAGIQVNGGGFINASRVTLTTGTAVMNPANGGSLDSYRIPKGTISVEGLGLDTRTADYTDILARSVQVNAGIWANRLKVVTGTNEVSRSSADYPNDVTTGVTPMAGSGPIPQFSLDVAALGGMYAGHIYLVGTEAGLGVRNQGTMGAQGGNLVLLSNGMLTNEGAIQAAAVNGSGGNLKIDAAGTIDNKGSGAIINAQGGNLKLSTQGALINEGAIQVAAIDGSGGTLNIDVSGNIDNKGSGAVIHAQDGNLALLSNGTLTNEGAIQASAANGNGGSLKIDVAGSIDNKGSSAMINAHGGNLELSSNGMLANEGMVQAVAVNGNGGNLKINVTTTIDNLGSNAILNAQGGNLELLSGGVLTNEGVIRTSAVDGNGGNLKISAVDGINNQGSNALFNAQGGDLELSSNGTLTNAGAIQAVAADGHGGNLKINVASSIDNKGSGATIHAQGGNLELSSGGMLTNEGAIQAVAVVGNGGALIIDAIGGIDNKGGNAIINARGGNLDLLSNGALKNEGAIQAVAVDGNGGNLKIDVAGSIDSKGRNAIINVQGGDLDVLSNGTLINEGAIQAVAADGRGGNLKIVIADSIDNKGSDAFINAQGGNLDLSSTGKLNNEGVIQTTALNGHGGNLKIDVVGDIANQGGSAVIHAKGGDLEVLSGGNLTNEGAIQAAAAEGNGGNLKIDIAGSIDNKGGGAIIHARGGNLESLSNGALTNDGVIQAAAVNGRGGNLKIDATDGIDNQGRNAVISAQAQAVITSNASLKNGTGATLSTASSLSVTTDSINNEGVISAAESLTLTARDIDNKVTGEISANTTHLEAIESLVNRGLIDGSETLIRTANLANLGTGRIYGDHLAIAANTITNDTETVNGVRSDAVIAARERLDIGVGTLNNKNGALIFSAGSEEDALNIGGNLNADLHAVGKASVINNQAATIESLGGLSIAAEELNNLNPDFSVRTETTNNSTYVHYVRLGGVRYLESALGRCFKCASDRSDNGDPALPRLEYVAPSAAYPFEAGYSRVPYQLSTYEAVDNGEGGLYSYEVPYSYPLDSSVWALFNVPVGDQDTLRSRLLGYNQNLISRAWRDFYQIWVTSTQTIQTVVDNPGVSGKIISGGGMALTGGAILNDNSQILAGGDLTIVGSTLTNTKTSGSRQVTEFGSWRGDSVKYKGYGIHAGYFGSGTYVEVTESVTTQLDTSLAEGNRAVTGTGTQVTSLATPMTSMVGAVSDTNVIGAATNPNSIRVVADSNLIRVPNSSLIRVAPDVTSPYVYETDPRFTNYRNWLSSDYMLQELAVSPTTTQKRIGDGFYEQKLVREQVAQLTGRRFLDGYANDEAQYQALMESGVTYAKQWNLVPGVSLSPEQIAQLTSDIVWLVAKEITLADGSKTTALVPQVYMVPKDSDLDASGSLLAGKNVNIQLSGDLTNAGTIAGRTITQINANNVQNLGEITGKNVSVAAQQDLTNLGGSIIAEDRLSATAGRNLTVQSTTSTASVSAGLSSSSLTQVDRVAGLYVTKDAGILVASAGNDFSVLAGVLSSKGDINVTAGNNVNLATVDTAYASDLTANARNYIRESGTREVGSQILSGGKTQISAGNDLDARAVTINAADSLAMSVGRDISITEGRANSQSDESRYAKSSGFLSKSTTEYRSQSQSDISIGSDIGGKTVVMTSGADTLVRGSNVVGDQDTTIRAGNNLTIEAATDHNQSSSFSENKKTGLYSGGGISISYGKQEKTGTTTSQNTSSVASTVGSVGGDIVLTAGQTYTQKASDVLAPDGNIDISAKTVDIVAAENAYTNTTEQKFKQSGITLALTGAVISAMQTVQQMAEAASDTKDGRMQALAGASAALSAKGAYDAIQKGQGTTIDGKENQMPQFDASGKQDGSRDATAAEQAGGLSISISIGASSSQSKTTQSGTKAVGSNVGAGGDVRIVASGAADDSNVTVQGSNISAGNNVLIGAENNINLVAAQNTDEQHSTNKSNSGSIGISFGTSTGITLGASAGRGNADGKDVTWTNTHVDAGNQLALVSGKDANLIGAVASGKQVIADVGGDLNIQSLQDTSQFDSKQKNIGGSLTIGWDLAMSASFNYSKSNVSSDYASVTETSGIKSGDGGFQVVVGGNTDLKGAVIASTEKAVQDGNNLLVTGSLTTSDIENKADYKAKSIGINVGTSLSTSGQLAPSGTSAGFGKDSGSASSVTKSGVSGMAGDQNIRSTDAETGIARFFDAERVQKEIDAQVKITQTFGREASKAVGDYAKTQTDQAKAIRVEANRVEQDGDAERAKQLRVEAQTIDDNWGDQGIMRLAAHTLIGGLTGGASGAAGAATSTLAAPEIAKALSGADIDPGLNKVLIAIATTTVGAAVGGATGGGAALNEVANNYLSHQEELERFKARKECGAGVESSCQEARRLDALDLQRDANFQAACGGGLSVTEGCASATRDLYEKLGTYATVDARRDATIDKLSELTKAHKEELQSYFDLIKIANADVKSSTESMIRTPNLYDADPYGVISANNTRDAYLVMKFGTEALAIANVNQDGNYAIVTPWWARNGMNNPPEYAASLMLTHIEAAAKLKHETESRNGEIYTPVDRYTLSYAPTTGFVSDVWSAFLTKIGVESASVVGLRAQMDAIQAGNQSVNWVAHSRGGAEFVQAAAGSNEAALKNNSVVFHAGANNVIVTNYVMEQKKIGDVINKEFRYRDSPNDLVPQIIGLRALTSPLNFFSSLVFAPCLSSTFCTIQQSPHTLPYNWNNLAPEVK